MKTKLEFCVGTQEYREKKVLEHNNSLEDNYQALPTAGLLYMGDVPVGGAFGVPRMEAFGISKTREDSETRAQVIEKFSGQSLWLFQSASRNTLIFKVEF